MSTSFLEKSINSNLPASEEFMNTKIIQPLNQMFCQTWRNIYNIYGDGGADHYKINQFASAYRPLNDFDVLNVYESQHTFSPQSSATSNVEFESKHTQFNRVKRDRVAAALLDSVGITHSRNGYSQFRISRDSRNSIQKQVPKEEDSIKKCCTIRPMTMSKFNKRMTALSPKVVESALINKLKLLTAGKHIPSVKKVRYQSNVSKVIKEGIEKIAKKSDDVKTSRTLKIDNLDDMLIIADRNIKKVKKMRRSCVYLDRMSRKSEQIAGILKEEIGGYSERDKKKLAHMFRNRNPLFIYGTGKPHYVICRVKPAKC
jgi:hypothetical protein